MAQLRLTVARASAVRSFLARALAVLVVCSVTAASARAQLKLPHRPKEAPTKKPSGDVTPHLDCLVCGTRTYTARAEGRKDEQGRDLVWCDACRRDTAHSTNVNTEPGIGRPGAAKDKGNLRLPRKTGQPATTEPSAAPSADAAPAPDGTGATAADPASSDAASSDLPVSPDVTGKPTKSSQPLTPGLVFAELRAVRNPSDALVHRAVESLLAAGEPGRVSARTEIQAPEPAVVLTAGRVLLRSRSDADFALVTARLREKLPGTTSQVLVEEAAAHDPVRAGPEWLAAMLEAPQSAVRTTAQRLLTRSATAEVVPFLARPALSKRVETRLAAVEVAASVADPAALELLLSHIDDPSSRVASSAVAALASRDDKNIDARLMAIAFQDRWILRRGSYAILAICTREDLRLAPVLGVQHVEPLLAALGSSDVFVAGSAAVALAGIGFRTSGADDAVMGPPNTAASSTPADASRAQQERTAPGIPGGAAWLDTTVVDRLVMTVSGREFHDDLSSLVDPALRRLRLVTGQGLPPDGPRWVDWWIQNRDGFHARRAELVIPPADVAATVVRCETSGDAPEAFALVGPDAAAEAESTITTGEIFYMSKAEIADLVALLAREGVLSAEKLPGQRGTRLRGYRTLEIRARTRAKDFTLGPGIKEPWFDRALEACKALRDKNVWQRFPESSRHKGSLALWREQSAWWDADRPQSERDERLKSLVIASMRGSSQDQRDLGVAQLEAMYARPDAVHAEDYGPLLELMTRESGQSDVQSGRARRLGRLALAAGRKIGPDDKLPDVQALEMAGACTKLFGTHAQEALLDVLEHANRSFVRTLAKDERTLVRSVVPRILARDPSAEDLAVLIALLDDKDSNVETAAALALGEHKVASAKTELLVRARVGLTPVRCAALEAIGHLGGEFVLEALIQGISDRDPAVRLASVKGLAALADPAAAQVLIAQLGLVGDPNLFDAARSGLGTMGSAAWPDLVRAVNQPSGNIRREAALILSEQSQPDAASPLLSILTANPRDTRIAAELAVLTCVDARTAPDPIQAWWSWWDGVRHDDANAWFRAALERVGMPPPPPSALTGAGTAQGRLFLVNVMARPEPWLSERARREYARLSGKDPGELPSPGPERDARLRALREIATREASRE